MGGSRCVCVMCLVVTVNRTSNRTPMHNNCIKWCILQIVKNVQYLVMAYSSHALIVNPCKTVKYHAFGSRRHHDMVWLATLLARCDKNPPVTGVFPSQRASYIHFCWLFFRFLKPRPWKTVTLPVIWDALWDVAGKHDTSHHSYLAIKIMIW